MSTLLRELSCRPEGPITLTHASSETEARELLALTRERAAGTQHCLRACLGETGRERL